MLEVLHSNLLFILLAKCPQQEDIRHVLPHLNADTAFQLPDVAVDSKKEAAG